MKKERKNDFPTPALCFLYIEDSGLLNSETRNKHKNSKLRHFLYTNNHHAKSSKVVCQS